MGPGESQAESMGGFFLQEVAFHSLLTHSL